MYSCWRENFFILWLGRPDFLSATPEPGYRKFVVNSVAHAVKQLQQLRPAVAASEQRDATAIIWQSRSSGLARRHTRLLRDRLAATMCRSDDKLPINLHVPRRLIQTTQPLVVLHYGARRVCLTVVVRIYNFHTFFNTLIIFVYFWHSRVRSGHGLSLMTSSLLQPLIPLLLTPLKRQRVLVHCSALSPVICWSDTRQLSTCDVVCWNLSSV